MQFEVVIDGAKKLSGEHSDRFFENVIEMSREFQSHCDHMRYILENDPNTDADLFDVENIDSRMLITLIPEWAVEFDDTHPIGYYDEEEDPHQRYIKDYYGDIAKFVWEKLVKTFPLA